MGTLTGLLAKENSKDDFELNRQKVKLVEIGSSGTEIFGGYLSEEYLKELQGKEAADTYDKMRRSDPKIKMVVSAMKNPIKGAAWEIAVVEGVDPKDPRAIAQQELIHHILFKDLGGKTWKKFLHEALSMIEFGYSCFEKTYKPVLGHPKFGAYNGIKSLGFRSQRTIERWNLTQAGNLASISQYAYGDFQKVSDIPASFLLHFALEMEGSNYEGISILRSCYGPWLRKNNFLKIIAVGIERYALGIPDMEIPDGEENSKQVALAKKALQAYVSGRAAYITRPKGWDFKITTNPFDADKVRNVVNQENVEIVNSALANFLELGQSGSGSYSLSFDLSDFFLGGLEYIADVICEVVNKDLIADLVAMNFGGQCLVELKCSGISDKAGEELSKVLLNLHSAGLLTPDTNLEDSLRKRFGLPARPKDAPEVVARPTDPKAPITPTTVPTSTADKPSELSLNGAQVTSMIEVVTKFKEGVLDQASAIMILTTAFPISDDQAKKIVGEPLKKAPIDIEAEAKAKAEQTLPKPLALAEEVVDEGGDLTKDPVVVTIDESAAALSGIIKSGLTEISRAMIDMLEAQWKKGGADKLTTPDLSKAVGQETYQKDMSDELVNAYNKAQGQVVEELPGAKVIKLAEDPKKLALVRIQADVMNLTAAQLNDLIKTLSLTYGQNVEAAQTEAELVVTLEEAVTKFVDGPVSKVGADIQASKTVNDSRRDFFKENTEQVISYTWINGDPVSDICQFLDGKTIPANSPDVDRYWPPLHHNCKTYVVANTSETTENPEPLNAFEVPEDVAASMTLSDLRSGKKSLTPVRKRRRIKS